jgi:methionine-rich copper-binding protein CopC
VARPWRHGAAIAAVAAVLVAFAQTREPAVSAHASFVSSVPATNSVIDQLPDTFSVRVAKKQATTAGDPIQVYDPAGQRIDVGPARVSDDGSTVSVDRAPGAAGAGEYQMLYRITSADTHTIVQRLTFTLTRAVGGDHPASAGLGDVATPRPLTRAGSPMPSVLVAIASLLAVLLALAFVRRRRPAAEDAHGDRPASPAYRPRPVMVPPQPRRAPAPGRRVHAPSAPPYAPSAPPYARPGPGHPGEPPRRRRPAGIRAGAGVVATGYRPTGQNGEPPGWYGDWGETASGGR